MHAFETIAAAPAASRPVASNGRVRSQLATTAPAPTTASRTPSRATTTAVRPTNPTPTTPANNTQHAPPVRSAIPSGGRTAQSVSHAHVPATRSPLSREITTSLTAPSDIEDDEAPIRAPGPRTAGARPVLFHNDEEEMDDEEPGFDEGDQGATEMELEDEQDEMDEDEDAARTTRQGRETIDFDDDDEEDPVLADDEELEDDEDDGRTLVTTGAKRRLPRNSSTNPRKKPKAGDYEGRTVGLVNLASAVTRAMTVSGCAWPDADKSIAIVEEAWRATLELRPAVELEEDVDYLPIVSG